MERSPASNQDVIGAAIGRAARKYRDRPALLFGDRSWSFAELHRAAERVAAGLRAAGLEPGDRVAAYGHNSDAYLLCWLGVAMAGLVHVPVNAGLAGAELGFIIRQSGARAIFCDADRLADARQVEEVAALSMIGSLAGGGDLDILDMALRGDAPVALPALRGGDLAQIQYTSGTTSAPKGAMMQHRAILAEYVSCMHALDYGEGDICLAALPLYHTAQMHAFTMPQLLAGATTHLIESPRPERVFERIESVGITSFFAPPTVWISLLRHPDFDRHDLRSLCKIYYGASIMPVPVLEEIRTRLPGARPYNAYGQSEIGPVATVLSPEEHDTRPASAGRPVLNVETRVVDEAMNDAAPGELGEIVHRSSQLLAGYWERPDETEAAFRGGWFHSGDLGFMDAEGYIFVVDRIRDVINTGGVLVAGREVEDVVFTHPAVSEVAVIALPDPKWIEAVTAVVVLRDGARVTAEELIAHVRARLAAHKTPKRIIFTDSLPRNGSGKLLKRELRSLYAEAGQAGIAAVST
ncbi:AMP-dependent synthetase and ligase [Rhizorhabdus wittichii RW1]|uniref:3-methylmercaptopropionyl-CoA ligase n=1 Tax=Rhizorhabdus wittichii (strain DSM 6014 / CCUG 31198 / JCM 15750 / NBRC 105917 / EY 4224 / RW1) TaxID=392499 RepID=A0A9J9LGJ8_RHIWR|nr:AMP-dependent synthetase and ligase [Rhizorhabdus wittichii RW1]